jgi:hypothetical protein
MSHATDALPTLRAGASDEVRRPNIAANELHQVVVYLSTVHCPMAKEGQSSIKTHKCASGAGAPRFLEGGKSSNSQCKRKIDCDLNL